MKHSCLAWARVLAAFVLQLRRDVPAVHEQAKAAVARSTAQGFPFWAAWGTSLCGWALAMQGQGEAGLAQMRQGLAAVLAMGNETARPRGLLLLAEVAGPAGQVEEGLRLLAFSVIWRNFGRQTVSHLLTITCDDNQQTKVK